MTISPISCLIIREALSKEMQSDIKNKHGLSTCTHKTVRYRGPKFHFLNTHYRQCVHIILQWTMEKCPPYK